MKVHSCRAFTLRDLLALTAVTSVFAFFALPLLARNKTATAAVRCMSNMRYLTVAWQLYAEENRGRLVENYQGGDAQGASIATSNPLSAPWACGWVDWSASPDNTNVLFIRRTRYAKLSPYITVESNVHKCPSDQKLSSAQRLRGWKERVRSVSMNATLGLPVAIGPFSPIYKLTRSLSDINNPGPAETFLFLDEHPDSINDPLLWPPTAQGWTDVPGNYHNGAGTFSFADGHVEMHRWVGRLRTAGSGLPGLQPDLDTHWLSYHSQRSGETSF